MTAPQPMETGRSSEQLFSVTPKAYAVRVLSGQFDASTFDSNVAQAAIERNEALQAYNAMHAQWDIDRHLAWDRDTDSKADKITKWSRAVANNTHRVITTDTTDEMKRALLLIGIDTVPSEEDLVNYYANGFYPNFAGSENRSIGNLGDFMFEHYKSLNGSNKAADFLNDINRLGPILSPILTEKTFKKFQEVMEARIGAAEGKLSAADGNDLLTEEWKKELGYFKGEREDPVGLGVRVDMTQPQAQQPQETEPTDEQKLSNIQQVLDSIERGNPVIHPSGNYRITGSALEDYVGDLKRERDEIQNRLNTTQSQSNSPSVPEQPHAESVPDQPLDVKVGQKYAILAGDGNQVEVLDVDADGWFGSRVKVRKPNGSEEWMPRGEFEQKARSGVWINEIVADGVQATHQDEDVIPEGTWDAQPTTQSQDDSEPTLSRWRPVEPEDSQPETALFVPPPAEQLPAQPTASNQPENRPQEDEAIQDLTPPEGMPKIGEEFEISEGNFTVTGIERNKKGQWRIKASGTLGKRKIRRNWSIEQYKKYMAEGKIKS